MLTAAEIEEWEMDHDIAAKYYDVVAKYYEVVERAIKAELQLAEMRLAWIRAGELRDRAEQQRDELLRVLRGTVHALGWHVDRGHAVAMDRKFLEEARAAIAKIEGGGDEDCRPLDDDRSRGNSY